MDASPVVVVVSHVNASPASSKTVTATESIPFSQSSNGGNPSKDQRRRFKKLRKRAERLCPQTDLSGIVQLEEWLQVKQWKQQQQQQQHQQPENDDFTFAPWIGMRQSKKNLDNNNDDKGKVRDGVDHRLALKCLLSRHNVLAMDGKSSTKRSRETDSIPVIPSWMTFHNPACVEHVAVLEVHAPGAGASPHLAPNVKDVEDVIHEIHGTKNGTGFPTRWFEGPRLQSISDVLLYEKSPQQLSNKKPKSGQKASSLPSSSQELMQVLQSLTLTQDELNKEGYPLPEKDQRKKDLPTTISTTETSSSMSSSPFRKPSCFSLEEARTVVSSHQVQVANRNVPFVMLDAVVNITGDDTDKSRLPRRVFGLDCEMVKTHVGPELARVTLIEYVGNASSESKPFQDCYQVLMDDLVVPYSPILDYVTEYSGITAKSLQNVATRLEQVQAALLNYIGPNDIVVGHSLENDLLATRWIHCNVIDTAILFRTSASFKHSLKHMSLTLLQKKIQGGHHHCSEEDAAATLELAIRRAEQGPTFALQPKDKQRWITVQAQQKEAVTVFIGPSQWLKAHVVDHPNSIHALTCEDVDSPNVKAIKSWLTGPSRRAGLVWANLTIATADQLKTFKGLLLDLNSKLLSNTVIMIAVQGGHARVSETAKRRRLCQNLRTASIWSPENEESFKASVDECRKGTVRWLSRYKGPSSDGSDTDKR